LARRLTATSLADTIDLKTALAISVIAPALGVLFCLRLPAPTAPDRPRREPGDQLAIDCGVAVHSDGAG